MMTISFITKSNIKGTIGTLTKLDKATIQYVMSITDKFWINIIGSV